VYLVLVSCIYAPAIAGVRRCARLVPLAGVRSTQEVGEGDVLVSSGPWTAPRRYARGDLVVYRIHGGAMGGQVRSGWGVDRIIGIPGDRVTFDGQTLRVNGAAVPPAMLPLAGTADIGALDLELPRGTFYIFPSLLDAEVHGPAAAGRQLRVRMLGALSPVRQADVYGKVVWRLRPWRRFGPME
jgi:hypothetical protein